MPDISRSDMIRQKVVLDGAETPAEMVESSGK